jgi:hypothetical protein
MVTEVLTGLDMNQIETEEFVLDNLAVAPATPVVGQQYFDTVLGFARTWNGTSWAASVSAVNKFAANVGNGVGLAFVVTHNLNTRDVVVSTYNNTTFDEAIATVQHTTVNTVTVTFGVPPLLNAYRVVVIG